MQECQYFVARFKHYSMVNMMMMDVKVTLMMIATVAQITGGTSDYKYISNRKLRSFVTATRTRKYEIFFCFSALS